MARNYELLLLETIENLGLVGDVVKVRPGFARNYLLPNAMAEAPTPEKIESLKAARAVAEAELSKQRAAREAVIARLAGCVVNLIRACNDQGVLYGAVTQRDISDQLILDGYGIDMRAVRLNNPIRRVGTQSVTIQFGRDLLAEVTVTVKADRIIELESAAAPSQEYKDDDFVAPVEETYAKSKPAEDDSKSDKSTKSARKTREKSKKD
ncbi:MAG: 50S ribosomal protein L9 [Phycisphaerales bacterium]|nr:50S ribosomal protein L9 [Phycisphaerales bacterium]